MLFDLLYFVYNKNDQKESRNLAYVYPLTEDYMLFLDVTWKNTRPLLRRSFAHKPTTRRGDGITTGKKVDETGMHTFVTKYAFVMKCATLHMYVAKYS